MKIKSVKLSNNEPVSLRHIAELTDRMYVVSRDAPMYLGGSMVTVWLPIRMDSFGGTTFGSLPHLFEVENIEYDNGEFVVFGQCDDDHRSMVEKAIMFCVDVQRCVWKDRDAILVAENGLQDPTHTSVWSYLADRGMSI